MPHALLFKDTKTQTYKLTSAQLNSIHTHTAYTGSSLAANFLSLFYNNRHKHTHTRAHTHTHTHTHTPATTQPRYAPTLLTQAPATALLQPCSRLCLALLRQQTQKHTHTHTHTHTHQQQLKPVTHPYCLRRLTNCSCSCLAARSFSRSSARRACSCRRSCSCRHAA